MNKAGRSILVSLMFLMLVIVGLNMLGGSKLSFIGRPKDLSVTEFRQEVESKNVRAVKWQENRIRGTLLDGSEFTVRAQNVDSAGAGPMQEFLNSHKVNWEIEPAPVSQSLIALLGFLGLPILLIFFFWLFFVRPNQAGGNQALSFGRSRARRVTEQASKVTFDDVAGIDEAKEELFEIVDFLKNTRKYAMLGAKIPKGILLTGPPGVGKTYLARAIAGEAGVPFFHISGSDFVEMFVGVGAARVRDLFETAKAHRPCLIFVDEIDAVGRQRGAGLGGGHDEREQTLNQLLVEMDGFDPNTGVILIAATNRPDVLDPALLRPGRFDRQIVVDPPDAKGRASILSIHSKGKPLEENVNLETLAKRTPGFTGADLANALNESALLAARRNKTKIGMSEIEEALDRVIAGPQRRSRVIDAKEREVIAYHEAGHAIIGEVLENCDPIHKVTILPRGMSLGSTWALPEQDSYLVSEQELLDEITMSLGGRVAEEVVFGAVYTGSSSDLERVTRIARAMVCEFGMSKKLGTLALGRRGRNPFLGRDYVYDERDYSEDVAKLIDHEIREIVEKCHQRAADLLTQHRDALTRLVEALLARESLNREQFLAALEGRPVPEDEHAQETRPESGEPEVKESVSHGAPPRFEPDPA